MISSQFKDHYVLVSNLNSLQDATEICHYAELVVEPLMLELNFNSPPLKHVGEIIVLRERICAIAVDELGLVGKKI